MLHLERALNDTLTLYYGITLDITATVHPYSMPNKPHQPISLPSIYITLLTTGDLEGLRTTRTGFV